MNTLYLNIIMLLAEILDSKRECHSVIIYVSNTVCCLGVNLQMTQHGNIVQLLCNIAVSQATVQLIHGQPIIPTLSSPYSLLTPHSHSPYLILVPLLPLGPFDVHPLEMNTSIAKKDNTVQQDMCFMMQQPRKFSSFH